MYEPLIIIAWLVSPIAGDAPMLDAILERYAFQHDIDGCSALSAGRQLNTHDALTYDMLDCVPLEKHTFPHGETCYCVSSPIVDTRHECTEHYVRRADFAELSHRICQKELAKLRQTTGPYAPSFEPHRVRTASCVCWYARGDAARLREWLKDIKHIGGKTAAGYGIVDMWTIDTAADAWLLASGILMRPAPASAFDEPPQGCRPYFGAIKPPYWHPMRQMEIYKPC